MATTKGITDVKGLLSWTIEFLQLVRSEIREGRLQRTMAIMAAFSAIVSGYEAYSQHVRGAFAHWPMWTPVWLTPPTVLAAGAALISEKAAKALLPVVSMVSLVDGAAGFVLHLRGIRRMPGGFKIGQYNVVMGPPIFAPLLICIVGILGIMASLLRPEIWGRQWRTAFQQLLKPAAATACRPQDGVIERFAAGVANGRFQRGMALAAAVLAALSGGEAYFEHLRGSFNRRVMWSPVLVSLPMLIAGMGAIASKGVARFLLPIAAAMSFFDGLLGFLLHLRGIKRMPGGFTNLRFNLTLGPPLFAPLLFTATGLLGIIATFLRRRHDQ